MKILYRSGQLTAKSFFTFFNAIETQFNKKIYIDIFHQESRDLNALGSYNE